MNEKFGFLSTFKGILVKPRARRKKPTQLVTGELTDNPDVNFRPELTDDESDGEDKQPAPVNRIFERDSSSLRAENSDKSYRPPKDKVDLSPELFNSDDLKTQPSNKLSDTVIGSFSDDELCSRMSHVRVAVDSNVKPIKRNKNGPHADTLIGNFSDVSQDEEQAKPSRIPPKQIQKKPPKPSLADTVIGFSDISSEQHQVPLPAPIAKARKARKVSLCDTIIGFSESIIAASVQEEKASVRQSVEPDEVIANSDNSVLSVESDYEDEVISILDSDEEISLLNDQDEPPLLASSDSFKNCSSINSTKTRSETTNTESRSGSGTERESETTLNKFFNNPPSIGTPERFVTHSMIRERKRDEANGAFQASLSAVESNKSLDHAHHLDESTLHESLEIPETEASAEVEESAGNDSDQEATSEVSEESGNHETPSSEARESEETQVETSKPTQQPSRLPNNKAVIGNINFSASININLKISMCESTSSSSESSPSPSNSPPARKQTSTKKSEFQQRKETPSKTKVSSARKENQMNAKKTPVACAQPSPIRSQWVSDFEVNSPRTPVRSEAPEKIIDEDLQEILDSLYGDTWKTPQLLRSCKSKKVREDLRKSVHANNFETFVKHIPNNLESTRIGGDLSEKHERKKKVFVTPSRSGQSKSTPLPSVKPVTPMTKLKKAVPKTPVERCRELCDSDTSSEESPSDSDVSPDETWNASSDGEYADEPDRIKKKAQIRKSCRKEEIIFVPSTDDKQRKLDDLLDRCEFKKPSGMPITPRQVAKKKLFTHSHFDEDADETPKEDEVKENVRPLHAPKVTEEQFATPGKKNVARSVTPKTQPLKLNNFQQYSFLKSLGSDVMMTLCNPEALYYRNNFKAKKEELTEILFKLFDEKVFNGALNGVPVKWNKRLTNTAGRCNNSRREGVKKCELELSTKVLTSADRLRCTLIHEMCHAATWLLHEATGHGPTWKKYAAKANFIFPEIPKISVCHDYVIEYRYTYKCQSCNAKYQTHSKSKKVELIRCSICKGSIELFLNKKDKDGNVIMTPVSKDVKGFSKFVQLNYKSVKKPQMTHKDVMQVLSAQFGGLTVEEKRNL